ncbi:hypothetical protein [Porphyromonas gingivalis]|uniref:hypothetical protein n=1 Tax=Porphyromonas gingivalis TaxID=837 RepID=UPI00211D26BE|nr:hypothetical protein [Porphyromonas gingivalis]
MKKLLRNLFGSGREEEKRSASDAMSGREQIVTNSEKSNLSTDPDHVNRQADTLKFDAIRAMNMGELVFATEALRKAMELRPEFETRYYLTEALLRRHLTEEALAQMNLLLEEVPMHTATLLNRAKLRLEQNDPSRALEDCGTGIESTSELEEQALFLYYGASAMKDMKNLKDALCLLKQAIEKMMPSFRPDSFERACSLTWSAMKKPPGIWIGWQHPIRKRNRCLCSAPAFSCLKESSKMPCRHTKNC